MKASRQEVIKAIESERDYQAKKWGEPPHSILDFNSFINQYVDDIRAMCTYNSIEDDFRLKASVLKNLRVIAGLAAAALEQHGVLTREEEAVLVEQERISNL